MQPMHKDFISSETAKAILADLEQVRTSTQERINDVLDTVGTFHGPEARRIALVSFNMFSHQTQMLLAMENLTKGRPESHFAAVRMETDGTELQQSPAQMFASTCQDDHAHATSVMLTLAFGGDDGKLSEEGDAVLNFITKLMGMHLEVLEKIDKAERQLSEAYRVWVEGQTKH